MGPDNFIGQYLQNFQGTNNSNFIQTIPDYRKSRGERTTHFMWFYKTRKLKPNEDSKKKENYRLILHWFKNHKQNISKLNYYSISIKNTKLRFVVSTPRYKDLGSCHSHSHNKKKRDELKNQNFSWIYRITEVKTNCHPNLERGISRYSNQGSSEHKLLEPQSERYN